LTEVNIVNKPAKFLVQGLWGPRPWIWTSRP